MSEETDSSDKSHEPTQKKLDDARKKGEIARSTDVSVALSYFGIWIFTVSLAAAQLDDFGNALAGFLEAAFSRSGDITLGTGSGSLSGLAASAGYLFVPMVAVPAGLIVAALVAQRGLIFTPSKLMPKLSRLSVLQNAKNKFGRGGLFEFAKSFTKLSIYSSCLAIFIAGNVNPIVGAAARSDRAGLVLLFDLATTFLGWVVLIAALIAVVDFGWQRHEHQRKNMMSQKDLKDEAKDSEGDPHLKQARRSKAQEIAFNQMLQDVPTADVIIVNPTHYAVALKWSGDKYAAPVCVAKGVDEIARRIRETAEKSNVPIHSDPPTARAIHAVVEIGREIEPAHYAAVAVAIQFAETLKAKKRRRP